MVVSLSMFAGAGAQFFDDNGDPLTGGKLFAYQAGTTTPQATYTTSAGNTPHTNPIILDSAGRVPNGGEIWLTDGDNYKFVVTTFTNVLVATYDQVSGNASGVATSIFATLAASNGSSLIGFIQGGSGAVVRTAQSKMRDAVSPQDFGAIGALNGGLDDTTAIQAAIDYAASLGKGIVLGGPYRVNFLTIKAGLSFLTSGTLIKTGLVSSTGLIVVNSDVRYCEISDIEMNLSATINRGIFCNGAANCTFDNNRIYNFPAYNSAITPEAIRLAQNSKYNHVSNNYIILPTDSPYGTYPAAIGIYVTSNALPLGGFETGTFVQPTDLAEKNKIYGNTILNGTHAISLFGGTSNEIYDNYIDGPTHRGIHLTPVASFNYIHGNKIYNFGSSAVVTAYGSNQNIIVGNYCYAPLATGEGGIQCYVGASGSVISGNNIYAGTNYGIYLAVNVNNCVVSENQITASLNKKSAIAIENDWESPLPAGALFSRPNYSPPPTPRTNWASDSTFDNSVSGNVITQPANTIAAIYVAQLGPTYQTTRNKVVGNTITGQTSPQYNAYYFEETAGRMSNEVLMDLATSDINASKVFFSGGRDTFLICSGNPSINESTVTIASGTTTPDVSVGGLFQHNDAAPTSVTNYLGAQQGQTIQVRLSANTTIVNNSSLIRLKGGVNVVGTSTNQFLTLLNSSGVWIEQTRNF